MGQSDIRSESDRRQGRDADLACGFRIGTSTVYRYVREVLDLLSTMAPTLDQADDVVRRKAFVILDGTLPRIEPRRHGVRLRPR